MVGWLATVSVLLFVASLIVVPIVVSRIPHDYFAHQRRPQSAWANKHFAVRAVRVVAKNTVGILLLFIGIAMLLLPGQGLLSIVMGVILLDFPRKFRLER